MFIIVFYSYMYQEKSDSLMIITNKTTVFLVWVSSTIVEIHRS